MIKNLVIALLAAPWVLFLYKLVRGQVTFTRVALDEPVSEDDGPALNWRMSDELSNILNRH